MEILKSTFLLIKYSVPTISNEQICLKLKVWISSFLNIRSSRLEVSWKKLFWKFLQHSLKNIKNISYAVFNLKG